MLLIDAHLDLAMNALSWKRDLTQSVAEIRAAEAGMTEKGRACNTVAFPEMRKGEIGISVVTVIARTARPNSPASGFPNQEISYAAAQGQLAYYRVLEWEGKVRLIRDLPALENSFAEWTNGRNPEPPLGFILSMEGADPIVSPEQLPQWWDDGLRLVGLSHYGVSAYAHGTGTEGGLTDMGRPLLQAMEEIGMILDVTHLADQAFWEALEAFGGSVIASHQCSRELCPGDRQFTDEQIQALIQRGAVIGAACDAWMLYPGWIKGVTKPEVVTMAAIVDNIDRVCQLAGNARHAAIGTDLDGGYGTEQTPCDLNTIDDLQQIPGMLAQRGYKEEDIRAIMHGNWMSIFRKAWG
jgi:membrane dipeptidase